MKAFVINEDQVKNLGLVLVLVIVAVFVLGYFLGSMQISAVNEKSHLIQDKENIEVAEDAAVKTTDKLTKAEKSKDSNKKEKAGKDTKASNSKSAKKTETKKSVSKKTAAEKKSVAKKETSKEKSKKSEKGAAQKKVDQKKVNQKKADQKKVNQKTAKKPVDNKKKQQQSAAKTTAPAQSDKQKTVPSDRVYSIQAGMFSSEANANSFIQKLSEKKFEAYLSSFESSSGATKYNVRVGKFAQREQARELLTEFQKSFSSPAYVVISQP